VHSKARIFHSPLHTIPYPDTLRFSRNVTYTGPDPHLSRQPAPCRPNNNRIVVSPALTRISDVVNYVVTAFCVGCLMTMLGISVVGAFYMVVTGDALSWTYSLARLFIPWLGLLSITVAFRRGEHIAMNSLMEILPRPMGIAARAANYVIVGIFGLLMIWYGMDYFLGSRDYFMVSDQIQIHSRWVAVSVPITGLVILIHVLCGVNIFDPANPLDDTDLDISDEEFAKAGLSAAVAHTDSDTQRA